MGRKRGVGLSGDVATRRELPQAAHTQQSWECFWPLSEQDWAFHWSVCELSTGEASWGMGLCLISASREAQRCLVIQQGGSLPTLKPCFSPNQPVCQRASACACCWRCQLQGNLQELPSVHGDSLSLFSAKWRGSVLLGFFSASLKLGRVFLGL